MLIMVLTGRGVNLEYNHRVNLLPKNINDCLHIITNMFINMKKKTSKSSPNVVQAETVHLLPHYIRKQYLWVNHGVSIYNNNNNNINNNNNNNNNNECKITLISDHNQIL